MKNITLIIAIILMSIAILYIDHNNKGSIALKRVDSLFNSTLSGDSWSSRSVKQDSIIFDKWNGGYGKANSIDGNTFFNLLLSPNNFSGGGTDDACRASFRWMTM